MNTNKSTKKIEVQEDHTQTKKSKDLPYIGPKHEASPVDTKGYLVESGWRINYNTYGKALISFFEIHNESVNIWSHFIGALIFAGLAVYAAGGYMDDESTYS